MYRILERVIYEDVNDYGDYTTADYCEIGVVMTEAEAKAYVDRYSHEHISPYSGEFCRGELIYEEVKLLDIDKDLDNQIKIAEEAVEAAEYALSMDEDEEKYMENLNSCKEQLERLKKIRAACCLPDPTQLPPLDKKKKTKIVDLQDVIDAFEKREERLRKEYSERGEVYLGEMVSVEDVLEILKGLPEIKEEKSNA